MAWTTPEIDEITCGMEINMYLPADEGREPEPLIEAED